MTVTPTLREDAPDQKKKKIWIQCFNYFPYDLGGSERSARELAVGLRDRGHEVEVLLSDGSRPYPDEVDGIALHPVEGLRIGKSPLWPERRFLDRMAWNLRSEVDPVLMARLIAALRAGRPDCIVMNNPAGHGSALMLAARLTGIPVLPVIRDYGWFCAFGVMFRDGRNCGDPCGKCQAFSLFRRQLLRGQRCIAISGFVADLVTRFVPQARVEIIPNSVNEAFFVTPQRPRTRQGGLHFGYLGRLHPTKGVDELVAGWIASGAQAQGHRLRLAGSNQGVKLPTQAEVQGIDLLGQQPAIPFLDDLDVLLIPSLWGEPFGRTVIEGLARGAYVVGAPNGAIPSLVPDGFGEILPEVSARAIAAVIARLARDPAPITALRARDRRAVLESYHSAHMLARYEAVIAALVDAVSERSLTGR